VEDSITNQYLQTREELLNQYRTGLNSSNFITQVRILAANIQSLPTSFITSIHTPITLQTYNTTTTNSMVQ